MQVNITFLTSISIINLHKKWFIFKYSIKQNIIYLNESFYPLINTQHIVDVTIGLKDTMHANICQSMNEYLWSEMGLVL